MKISKPSSSFKGIGIFIILTAIILLTGSCVGARLLQDDQYLYAGAKIKVHADQAVAGKSKLEGLLKDETYPLPNRRILGLPYKLWIYSIFSKKNKKNNSFIANNYGERPVLLNDVPVDEVSNSLHTVLKANGYLDSRVSSEVIKTRFGKKQRKVLYHCYVEPAYHLRNISIDIPDTMIVHLIDSVSKKSILHPGDQYNLVKLNQERERIDNLLKTKGFYFFSPDFLYYLADSAVGNRQIDLTMTIKHDVDPINLQPWYIDNVMVFDNSVRDSLTMNDTVNYKGVTFLTGKLLKPKLIRHFILFSDGNLLTTDNYNITNRNLASLSAFKYTNIKAVIDTDYQDRVDINIDLTPNSRHNFRASADMISKSNDFAGPAVELGYVNRNLWGGGEELSIKTNGSIEAWLQKTEQQVIGNKNFELNASAELKFPRFLFFDQGVISSRFIPSNHIRVDTRYTNQMRFYKMSFIRLLYGYRWSETLFRSHELNIMDVTYQHLLGRTFIFDSLVNKNPLLKQSYSDQFMIGTNYTYHYAVPDNDPRRFKTAFTGALDMSGNSLYGIQYLLGKRSTPEKPLKFLGTTYSQYVKTTVDYRMYYDLSRKNRLATRISAGVGLPVGNSGTLPGIKQYFLGGANSIRAFRFRSVGPGAYGDSATTNVLINHSGEIMFLWNIENRLKIAKSFEWALFLDAGNIWLAKNDPLRTGAQFNRSTFLKQLAIGWGMGLRYLNQYFIIRIDAGIPLYSPNPIQKASDLNTVWNFAIGYPF